MIEQRFLFGNLLQEYYVNKVRGVNRERKERIDRLASKEDAQKYVEQVRAKIKACFDLPEHSGVPEHTVVKTVKKGNITIENIIYYSRPDFPVTANLYLPEASGKVPCVLFLCGHSQNGKASDVYRRGCMTLAKQGYAVLIVDPVSQGERYQFLDIQENEEPIIGGRCTSEHNVVGKQLMLAGEFFGTWRAYDAIRGLDYLLSRPEVDTSRVGITGNSGGGTMTSFVQALDPRFTMAAPSCYITSWQRNIENELPADIEQIPPGILGAGCEMGDLILAYAPRPILLLGQKNDFFDARGLRETYEQVKQVYTLLGYPENIQCFTGPVNHGYSIENRCAMYDFFKIHSGITAETGEDESLPLGIEEKELYCVPSGQVHLSMPNARRVNDFAKEIADKLAAGRRKLSADELKAELRRLLALPGTVREPYCRTLRGWCKEDANHNFEYIFSRFGIESEPNMVTTLKIKAETGYLHFPAAEKLSLYIPHCDGGSEGDKLPIPEDAVLAVYDLRGVGESTALGCDLNEGGRKFTGVYGSLYHYNSCALMLGEVFAGRQVFDILSAVAFMKARGVGEIHIHGRGNGAIPAALAGLLSDDITSVTLQDAPESYRAMIESRIPWWPNTVFIPGILKSADLGDIYEAIAAAKPFKVMNFIDDPTKIEF